MATIQGIYVALFGRPADPAGLAFFNEATNNGSDLTAIGDLASTAEYQARFTGMTNEQIVNSIYQSLFERDGEAAGIDFFVGELEAGRLNINNIAIAILDGAQNDDLTTVNAKIAAANLFTTHLDQQVEIDAYAGDDAAAIGRTYIDAVTGTDAATEAEADAAILLLLDEQGGQDPDGGNGGGGGGGGGDAVFFVTHLGDQVSFSGSATGDITVSIDAGTATFARGGVVAFQTVPNVTSQHINLTADQKLVLAGDQADDLSIKGAGTVAISGIDSDDNLSGIEATGTVTLDGNVTLEGTLGSNLAVTVDAGQTLTLTADQTVDTNITGAGSMVVSGSADSQVINALTSGGNNINGGAGADTIVSGAGNDVIDGGDVVTPGVLLTPASSEVFTFSVGGQAFLNFNGGNFTFDVNGAAPGGNIVVNYNWNDSYDAVGDKLETALDNSGFSVARAGVDGRDFTVTYDATGPQPDVVMTATGNRGASSGATEQVTHQGANATFGADNVTASADTLTGGDGADKFVIKASTLTAIDEISDLDLNEGDTIDFTTAATWAGDQNVAGAIDIQAAVNIALGNLNAGQAGTFTYGSETYLILDANGGSFTDGHDQIVNVTGFEGAFSNASFV